MVDETNPRVVFELHARLAQLEERVARLEAERAGQAESAVASNGNGAPPSPIAPLALPAVPSGPQATEEIEYALGQSGFAGAGVLALTVGVGFLLALPYPALPPWAPATLGFAGVAALFGVLRRWRQSVAGVVAHLRGAGMALAYFSTLRLFYFVPSPVLRADSAVGQLVLGAVVALNLGYALRRGSAWLLTLALAIGYVTALAVGAPSYLLPSLLALAGVVVFSSGRQKNLPALLLAGTIATHATYFLWVIGNPFHANAARWHFVAGSPAAPLCELIVMMTFAAPNLWRPDRELEQGWRNVGTFLNCGLGYGAFLLHTAAAFPASFAGWHAGASLLFLTLALVLWRRTHGPVTTFFHAMTGYAALSMAIIKLSSSPAVFVWLSLQSLVVITTAIGFRSRFIVVGNFFMYALIVLAYVFMVDRETGISIGFGLVALLSARILNWKKNRLELRTEAMRNAYLASAFCMFPYALFHLVPRSYVGLGWVGLAATYYGLNLLFHNAKYRWMGHGTLLLTAVYVTIVGTREFEPLYRVLSFLALGALLLIVSVGMARARRKAAEAPAG